MSAIDFPVAGQKVIVHRVPGEAVALQVTYQPDAPIAEVQRLELSTGQPGQVREQVEWTPSKPGIAKIEAVAADGSVVAGFERSVKFDGTPDAGVGIFVMAAVVLFGGSALSLRLLLRND
jgi:hypothetical protein